MSNYFNMVEFQCRCGRAECDAIKEPHPAFLLKLNVLRMLLKRPVIINSGIRCEWYNKREGGVPGSQHVTGEAADLRVLGSRERYQIVEAALNAGFKRIGVAKTFVHVDVGTEQEEVLWTY